MTYSLREVESAVCRVTGLTPWQVHSESRRREVAFPRMVIFYLMRELTKRSLPWIGAQFGKDHTTVLSGIRRIANLVAAGDPIASTVEAARVILGARAPGQWVAAASTLPLVSSDPAYYESILQQCRCGRGPKVDGNNICEQCFADLHSVARKALAQHQTDVQLNRTRRHPDILVPVASSGARP